ncbi:MAG: tetratricopeptide repeat protein [Muribaculaceae bacterium]|nr:tetratricopeptide repeat protein [Muribaculaceae bacterium]
MKKSLLAALLIPIASIAFAQTDVVKEVEHDLKAQKPNYQNDLNRIKPALTNPETSSEALTWYLAGKAGVGIYDDLFTQLALGREIDKNLAGTSIVEGMGYFVTALPLDTVIDAKGKAKTKYSKDIAKQLQNHYNDLNTAGVYLWEAQNYAGAYDAWDMYLNLPKNPILANVKLATQPDSIMSEIAYNQALAAWQADSLENALKAFDRAMSMGYDKKNVYDYAIAVAATLGNSAEVTRLSEIAYPLYGAEDPKYLQLIINSKIEAKEYDQARNMLDEAIADQPDNANLYFVLGVLEETLENKKEALEDYKKAATLNPEYAQALYYVGRSLCNEAFEIDDKASQLPMNEYQQVRQNEVNPLFKEASTYLEKAYALDPDEMHDALIYLRNVYYNLNDEENLKRVESL